MVTDVKQVRSARGGQERRDHRARVEREDLRPVKPSEDKLGIERDG